ncbi:MAG: hypothetical protein NDI62_03410 [Burkholderiales bacterium]|nr:hypothetical protein [Burkholderiales bacterium]
MKKIIFLSFIFSIFVENLIAGCIIEKWFQNLILANRYLSFGLLISLMLILALKFNKKKEGSFEKNN